MNINLKNLSLKHFPRQRLFSAIQVACVIAIAYYMAMAVIAGAFTLGAFIYALFPVFILISILFFIQTQKSYSFFSFSLLPSTLDVKTFKKGIVLAIIGLIVGTLLLYSGVGSTVSLVMIVLVIMAAGLSAIFMLKGESIKAVCVFILVLPFIIFENGHGLNFFRLNRYFEEIFNFAPEDWVTLLYVCLLLMCWIMRLLVKPRRLVPETFSFGIWCFVFAGIISATFSPYPVLSFEVFAVVILVPVLLFCFFANEVRSLNDLKKLSLAIGCSVGVITFVWLYYALYRNPAGTFDLNCFSTSRGGGGLTLGSKYEGYNGVYYEYISPLVLPSVFALFFTANNRIIKIFWIAIAGLMICATFLTFGRIGWIAIFLCLLPWLWNIRHGRLLGFLSLIFCGLAVFYSQGIREEFYSVFSRFGIFFSSWSEMQAGDIRFRIYKSAIQMLLAHPWTGIGVGMFSQYSGDYGLFLLAKDAISGAVESINVSEAHGTFFQIISELGILGLISWGAMLWIPLRFIISKKGNTKGGGRASPWRTMLLSYSLVLTFFFFFGAVARWGGDSIKIIILFIWLAAISKKDDFLRDTPD